MAIKTLRLALIGFGTVGQGLVDILLERGDWLQTQHNLRLLVVGVSDLIKGALYHPDGLDLRELLKAGQAGKLDANTYPDRPGLVRGLDSLATIAQSNADVVVEVSYTDLKTGQPAIDHVKVAFRAGKHAVITNKGPVALAYRELADLARSQGVCFGYEGTVMSGTPALRMAQHDLAGCQIRGVTGILNGTTNYILTKMEGGAPYASALAEAQAAGYAEADPTGDVEGFDAAGKLVILANTVLGGSITMNDVERVGITKLTPEDIAEAHAEGMRWKLIARAAWQAGKLVASVKPTRLLRSDPLAAVGGATNAITYDTDLLGPVTLVGAGAGRRETGFAILSDLIDIARHT